MMALIKNYKFQRIYGDGLKGTIEMSEVFDWLLFVFHNDLYEYMRSVDINSVQFFTQWVTGLFTCELDKESIFKIWDIFFKEGWKIIFRLGLAIIKDVKENLFKIPPEDIVSYLRHFAKNSQFN